MATQESSGNRTSPSSGRQESDGPGHGDDRIQERVAGTGVPPVIQTGHPKGQGTNVVRKTSRRQAPLKVVPPPSPTSQPVFAHWVQLSANATGSRVFVECTRCKAAYSFPDQYPSQKAEPLLWEFRMDHSKCPVP